MALPFSKDFPKLQDVAQKKTSDPSDNYNCIAWAFKDTRRFWWPNDRRTFWPLRTAPAHTTMSCFEALFMAEGWEETASLDAEDGYEKIALFALNGIPTHACRLLDNGAWTSKLGRSIDISHDIAELEGPAYGEVAKVYRKPSNRPAV